MITETEITLLPEIRKLAAKPKWPYEQEAQLELARVARKYGRNLMHLRAVIREISEQWDHCPDGRELREALMPETTIIPDTRLKPCRLGKCDGSGWILIDGPTDAVTACACRMKAEAK